VILGPADERQPYTNLFRLARRGNRSDCTVPL